jgi:hypothetical protein
MACEEGKWLHDEFRKAALARIEGADAKPAPFVAELKAKRRRLEYCWQTTFAIARNAGTATL